MDFGISIHLLSEYRKLMFPSMEPLTENDIPRFDSMDLDQMDLAKLEELEYQLEDLRSDMEYREPGSRGSEEYRLWRGRLAKVEAFLDSVLDHLEEIGESVLHEPIAVPV